MTPDRAAADVTLVVPTIGRPSLARLLASLRRSGCTSRVVVVDDRPGEAPLAVDGAALDVEVRRSGGRGPAAARNTGWRGASSSWVVFVDDDVEVTPSWWAQLREDLRVPPVVGAVQGRIHVPLPSDRRPTDRERNVAALETAPWITADMAVRTAALAAIDGFDERFPRAYREDSDLAIRLQDAGWQLASGARVALHPVQPAPWPVSIAAQRGNADDALMRRLHGPAWRARAGAPRDATRRYATMTALAAAALVGFAADRPRLAATATAGWWAMTLAFFWRRVRPGPRTPHELATMAVTSVVIPPAALWWSAVGTLRARRLATRRRG